MDGPGGCSLGRARFRRADARPPDGPDGPDGPTSKSLVSLWQCGGKASRAVRREQTLCGAAGDRNRVWGLWLRPRR
jgi:hypothetical protein